MATKMKTLALISTLLHGISAHTRFTTLFVNSQSQGDGTCIRMDMNPSTTTDWIPGISSAEMACGVEGNTAVDRTCSLKTGDSISLLHRLWADGSQPGSIDPSHKGSTAVYMKKLGDASSTDPYSNTQASGDGWFKIAWDGYDTSSGKWGTERMIANKGMVSATVPNDLSSGYYLIRSEILALQNIVDGKVQPQFYAGCAQVYLTGNGATSANPETVSIPGYIDDSTAALSYDVYSTKTPAAPYQEFGPKVYGAASSTVTKLFMEKKRDRDDDDDNSWKASFSRWASRHRPWGNNNANETSSTDSSGNTLINVVDDNSGSETTIADSEYIDDSSTSTVVDIPISTTTTHRSVHMKFKGTTTSARATTSTNAVKSATTTSASQSQSKPTTSPSTTSSSSSSGAPIGSCPGNTILAFANKCIAALESWSADTPGSLPKCWAASQACWDKNQDCWATLSPAINANDQNAGCHLWENYCNKVVDWCKAGNVQGPPDAGFGGGSAGQSSSEQKKREEVMTRRNIAARYVLAARRRNSK